MGISKYSPSALSERRSSLEFVTNPERISDQETDWIDDAMGWVMTAGVCGTFTLFTLIVLKTLVAILIGGE